MTETDKKFIAYSDSSSKAEQKRVAFIKRETSAAVHREDEEMIMSFPHLVIRGIIALQVLIILLSLVSLIFDAPLKHIADPQHTEVPAKAPWYFLGLQELLHYFPPVVGGVLIPTLVVLALIVIPYFDINIKRQGLWESKQQQTLFLLTSTMIIIVVAMIFFHAWAISVPTILVYGFMMIPYFFPRESGFLGWLREMSLTHWIMTWFVVIATVLTIIGVFFRGPYWRWSWPWIEGIY
ncbi:MAG: hypothetical protein ACE5EE_02260 [Fidelibacterota bacterium]